MRQLTSLDAQFLALEDGRNHGHVSAVGVYDPTTASGGGAAAPAGRLTLEALHELVAQRNRATPATLLQDGVGLSLTVLSYRGNLDLGVIGDRELAPDVWELIDDVYAELAELRRLLPKPARRPTKKKEVSR